MKQKYSLVVLFIILINSTACECLKTVTIMKNQRLYAYEHTFERSVLMRYKTSKPVTATIREEDDALYIKVSENDVVNVIPDGAMPPQPSTGSLTPFSISMSRAQSQSPKFWYSAIESSREDNAYPVFAYMQWKLNLQGMAIPLKFRKPVGNGKAQVETGLSFALAPSLKHSWNWYRGSKDVIGLKTTSLSVAFGGLAGLGVVDVNPNSTQKIVTEADASKNAIIPLGFHLVGGINNINIGAAIGWDVITGPNREHWQYKGQMWKGVIIGLDILK